MLKKTIIYIFSILIFVPQPVFAIEYMASTPAAMNRPAKAAVAQGSLGNKEAFKQQIQAIKDTRKKQIVEKINTRLGTSNTNLTGKMQKALDRMSAVLEKVASREATLAAGGTNTTTLKTAIATAKTAIANAQTAVDTQEAMVYTGTIVDEATLGSVISQLVQKFRQDIVGTHNTVKAAKTAVVNAMQELAKLTPTNTQTTPVQ